MYSKATLVKKQALNNIIIALFSSHPFSFLVLCFLFAGVGRAT